MSDLHFIDKQHLCRYNDGIENQKCFEDPAHVGLYISRIFVGFYERNKVGSFCSTMKKVIDNLSKKYFTFRKRSSRSGSLMKLLC